MNAGNLLRASEVSALNNSQFISSVKGKALKAKPKVKRFSFSVMFLVTLMIAVFAVLFTSGNLIPSAISERLIEETDIQYADAVQSKMIVFSEALKSGSVPSDTARILSEKGVEVGYLNDGSFVPANTNTGELVLRVDEKIIEPSNFVNEANSNIKLYDAFNAATYSRAAYYFDDSANEVFKQIGTSRNNYNANSDFNETMGKLVGEGSNVDVNGVTRSQKTKEEDGKKISYYEYEKVGTDTSSNGSNVRSFIEGVLSKNPANSSEESTLSAAEAINIADTASKEQRSSLFFLAFMENISKMKAGYGSDSKITDAMNYLNQQRESKVININTGEEIILKGSMLESPSLYSVLSGEKLKTDGLENFASDRILYTIENQTNSSAGISIIANTISSVGSKIKATIGRLISGNTTASYDSLSRVELTVDQSLFNNSFSSIGGIDGGELLVEGAVNVGRKLAEASGATAGDEAAIKSYSRLTSNVLAMDAKVDRIHRSPFDITSKNTFLGSLIYNFAIHIKPGSFLNTISSFSNTTSAALLGLMSHAYADDESDHYLNNYGNCKTINSILGAVGSEHCSIIGTFDTSTLDPYNDAGFIDFVNSNTSIDSDGNRVINKGSVLSKFIKYHSRITPAGVTDGSILSALTTETTPWVNSSLSEMVKDYTVTSDEERRIASGAAFVNSASNSDWQQYKYAQRYVSLSRAKEAMKKHSTDTTAYSSIPFFEGDTNPVIAHKVNYLANNK